MPILNFKNLKSDNAQFSWFLFDVFMVILALININLIIFDFTFSYDIGEKFYQSILPTAAEWYKNNIHVRFIFIDLAFVAVFLVEFLIRWIIAIKNKEYQSWIIFPLARWYDLLGLIPIGSFRFLRILRVISILLRLNKMGVLNLRALMEKTGVNFYYKIFVEEVSDRVVLNVLNDAQNKVHSNDDVIRDLVTRVLKPNNDRLVKFGLEKAQEITRGIFTNQKDEIRQYIFDKVNEAVAQNKEMKMIGSVPGLGGVIRKQLDHAIGDITYLVVAGMVEDIADGTDVFSKEIPKITHNILSTVENDAELEEILKDVVSHTLEIVKERVAVKEWQIKMNEENSK
jgi:hypothetical protein